jgi:hypothetical protein
MWVLDCDRCRPQLLPARADATPGRAALQGRGPGRGGRRMKGRARRQGEAVPARAAARRGRGASNAVVRAQGISRVAAARGVQLEMEI